ncbi:MAG: acyltransferase [Gammaproteobacteria bacterium]|nr:acyltransferase [Gammaproteobacteria bacterium]MDH5652196.1 acyltransferase [Gammaproteobacteria bacterium]
MKYRPEIDGLRAVAIISVIIYHAGFSVGSYPLLKGGFLGVDIFFVISGYLITSLIIKELQETGRFSIINFYERRTRRLLPALLTVIIVSLPFAWLFLIPNQLIDYSKSIISSVFFSSNFYWLFSLQEYDSESALLKPFLHTWSLAVEEQYYIFFPLILVAIYKWNKPKLLQLLGAGFILSICFAVYATNKNLSFSFYMLPSRFWELLAGAILATTLIYYPQQHTNNLLCRTMPVAGLFLITASLFLVDLTANHPGIITLIPVAGTVLIIWYSNEKDIVTKLLTSKPFVTVGLLSYSMYLWHYPLFAFSRIKSESISLEEKLLLILMTVVLSIFSYLLIEKPFRNKNRINIRTLVFTLGTATIIVLIITLAFIYKKGLPDRLPRIIANIETNVLNVRVCKSKGISCTMNSGQEKTLFLVGDSHMMPLEKPLFDYSLANRYTFNILNTGGCQYILNLNRVNKKTQKIIKSCTIAWQDKRRNILLSSTPATVIIGGRLPLLLSEESFNNQEGGIESPMLEQLQTADNSLSSNQQRKMVIFKEYKNSILELAEHGHKIILVYPVPEVGRHVPQTIQKMTRTNPQDAESILARNPITTSYKVYLERTRESFLLLDSIQHKNIRRVYPHKLFCNTAIKERCVTHNQTNSFYRDDDHLSDAGAGLLVNEIKLVLEKN